MPYEPKPAYSGKHVITEKELDEAYKFALESRAIKEFEKSCRILGMSQAQMSAIWERMEKEKEIKKYGLEAKFTGWT